MKCWMSFLGLYISIQHELCNINGILVRFTNKFLFTSCYLRILFTIVNGDWKICYACRVIWINWFRWRKMYSWKTRPWIKRRSTGGYFNSIIGAMMIEDRMGFKKMFQMNVYVKHSCIVAHRCQPEKNEKTIFFYLKNKTKKNDVQKNKIKIVRSLLPRMTTSIQFRTKDFLTPHRYKRILSAHLQSNWH